MKYSVKRLLDLCFLSLVSTIIVAIASKSVLVQTVWTSWFNLYSNLPPSLNLTLPFVVGALTHKWVMSLGFVTKKNLNFPNFSYLSTHHSIWLPIIYLFANYGEFNLLALANGFSFVFGCTTHVFIVKTYSALKNKQGKESDKNAERSIKNKSELEFDREQIVNKFKRLLEDSNTTNIALCGNFGTGKTSIIDCLYSELNSNKWVTISIETWGQSIDSVNLNILTKVLEKLSCHFDTLALTNMPEKFHRALKAKGGFYSIFSILTENSLKNVDGQFTKLDDILKSTGKKILIVIEDIDRSENQTLLCNQVAALLERLKYLNQVRFIITTGYENSNASIINRICEYREDLLNIDSTSALSDAVIQWVNKANVNDIWLHETYLEDTANYFSNFSWTPSAFDKLSQSLNLLISTPRTLKELIRHVNQVWNKDELLGEVDLIQLIVFQAIKLQLPNVYSKMQSLNRDLIYGKKSLMKDKEVSQKDIDEITNFIYEQLPSHLPKKAFDACFSYLFPLWPNLAGENFYNQLNTQKINSQIRHTDYYNRLLTQSVPNNEVRDQAFIIDILKFKNENDDKFESEFIQNILNNLAHVELLKRFAFFWFDNEKTINKYVLSKFIKNILRHFAQKYENGFKYKDGNLKNGSNIVSLDEIIDWLSLFTEQSKNLKLRNTSYFKLILKKIISVDLLLTWRVLYKLPVFVRCNHQDYFTPILCDLISQSRISSSLIYDYNLPPSLLREICFELSYKKNDSTASNHFSISLWEPLLQALNDKAQHDPEILPSIATILGYFSFTVARDSIEVNEQDFHKLKTETKTNIANLVLSTTKFEMLSSFELTNQQGLENWYKFCENILVKEQ